MRRTEFLKTSGLAVGTAAFASSSQPSMKTVADRAPLGNTGLKINRLSIAAEQTAVATSVILVQMDLRCLSVTPTTTA